MRKEKLVFAESEPVYVIDKWFSIPFLYAVLLFVNLVYYTLSRGEHFIPYQNLLFTCLDFIFTLMTVITFICVNKRHIPLALESMKRVYEPAINYAWPFLLPIVYLILKEAGVTYFLVLDGATRDYIALEVPGSRFMGVMSPLFLYLAAYSLINRSSKFSAFLIITGFLGCLMHRVSRSPLHSLLQLALIFSVLRSFSLKVFVKLIIIALFLVLVGAWVSFYLQGRGVKDIFEGVVLVMTSVGRYAAGSVFLADYAIEASNSFEKILFPFFGYLSEKFLIQFSELSNPISVADSRFVVVFRYIGKGDYSNVLYPWWAWFYGSFGLIGFFLKAIYIYILFSVAFYYRMFFFCVFLFHMALFSQISRHPLLNADNFYLIFSVVFFDVFVRFYKPLIDAIRINTVNLLKRDGVIN